MNILFNPEIFYKKYDGVFWVSFPHFEECLTEGADIQEDATVGCCQEALVNNLNTIQ